MILLKESKLDINNRNYKSANKTIIYDFKSIKQNLAYYLFGSDNYTDKIERFLHALKRTNKYAGRLDKNTVLGSLLDDHVIIVTSSTWAEDVDFLLASGIPNSKIILFVLHAGDLWSYYEFMDGLLDQLDVSEDGQSWRIQYQLICDKLVKLQAVIFETADGTRIMDLTCFHSYIFAVMGPYMGQILTVANGFSDAKSKTLYIDLLRWDHVTKFDYYIKEIFNKIQYNEYITLRDGDVVFNCGVASGSEIPVFCSQVGVTGMVHCIDPFGLKYLDDYVKTTADYFKDSIVSHEIALMDYTGQTQFQFSGDMGHGSKSVTDGSEKIKSDNLVTFPCFTIDDFAEKIGLTRLDLIKMDLEGEELKLMEGTVKLCNKFRCQVAITIYHAVSHYWEIPLFFMERLRGYSFHLGSYCAGRFEIVLYMIPKTKEMLETISDTASETVLTLNERDRLGRNCAPLRPDIIKNRWQKL